MIHRGTLDVLFNEQSIFFEYQLTGTEFKVEDFNNPKWLINFETDIGEIGKMNLSMYHELEKKIKIFYPGAKILNMTDGCWNDACERAANSKVSKRKKESIEVSYMCERHAAEFYKRIHTKL